MCACAFALRKAVIQLQLVQGHFWGCAISGGIYIYMQEGIKQHGFPHNNQTHLLDQVFVVMSCLIIWCFILTYCSLVLKWFPHLWTNPLSCWWRTWARCFIRRTSFDVLSTHWPFCKIRYYWTGSHTHRSATTRYYWTGYNGREREGRTDFSRMMFIMMNKNISRKEVWEKSLLPV